ncbi:MAG: biotin--[acetyl-CoA-carboxylase] ligase, partial [Candidatus Marinamargulisbacteria bacterium]
MTSASRLNDILKTTTHIQWGCHYARTGSTNADALSLIRSTPAYLNVPGMVVADHQTSGKGRQNKSWDAPPGVDILMSAVVWPTVPVCDWPTVPFALGLAVRAALRPHVPSSYSVQLKWPNDILINHQKCVGLLAEADTKRHAVVLGVGINVNQLPTDTTRTSLRVVNQMLMDRWGILSDVIHSLDTHWTAIESG